MTESGDTTLRRGFATPRLAWLIVQIYPRLLGILLLVTAAQKAWDESGVARVLEFDGVPRALVGPMVQGIASLEAFIGVLLLLRSTLKPVIWATIGLISIYTLQLAWLAMSPDAPGCACLAAWEAHRSARMQNLLGIGRNVCMIIPLIWIERQIKGIKQFERIRQIKGTSDTSAASP